MYEGFKFIIGWPSSLGQMNQYRNNTSAYIMEWGMAMAKLILKLEDSYEL